MVIQTGKPRIFTTRTDGSNSVFVANWVEQHKSSAKLSPCRAARIKYFCQVDSDILYTSIIYSNSFGFRPTPQRSRPLSLSCSQGV